MTLLVTANDWSTWQTSLTGIFATLLGLTAPAVSFGTQPRGMVEGATAQITPIAIQHHGVDDIRRTLVDGQLVEQVIGHRTLVLQARVWSPRQSLQNSSRALIERLRTRLSFTSTTEALLALDLGFQRAEQPADLTQTRGGREETSTSIDLFLSYAWVETDDTPGNALDYINEVHFNGHVIRDVDGDPVPSALLPELVITGA